MTTQNQMHEKMSLRVFIETLKSDDFLTTEQIVERLDGINFWDENATTDALFAWKKSFVRREMRRIKDGRGRPVFANVELVGVDGAKVNAYMQESLFEIEHFKQVIAYHIERAQHHISEAHEYKKDLKARYSVQMDLPFDLPDMKDRAA